MNPRLIIYIVGLVLILFVLASIYRTYRMSKNPNLKQKYSQKPEEPIEDAKIKEE